MKKYIVTDERSAGFTALGHALVSRLPVALICTSGTAALNYAPAIAEAYYQNVPLIVISADRPMEWIDQDDSQTMRQQNIFANYSKYFADINAEKEDEDYLWYVNRLVNEGLISAVSDRPGPVHFNVHISGTPISPCEPRLKSGKRFRRIIPEGKLPAEEMKNLVIYAAGKKIMIVAGFMSPDNKIQRAFNILESLDNVCVMAETVSNLHLSEDCYMVDTCLFKLSKEEKEKHKPDLVISVGGALISRKLKEFLRNHPPKEHWAIGPYRNISDCFRALTAVIDVEPKKFLPNFATRLQRQLEKTDCGMKPGYKQEWENLRYSRLNHAEDYPWSDLYALDRIFRLMPEGVNLFLSNGTSVRYGQILCHRPPHASFANRGVSGIEGSTSTAFGGMLAYPGITCLVTGDLSFCYDIGALGNGMADSRMKVVVLNNKGGDIFRFIKATSKVGIREKYLCVDSDPDIEGIAEAYGWEYLRADSKTKFVGIVNKFFTISDRPTILEIDTRDVNNSEILLNFLNNYKQLYEDGLDQNQGI